MGSVKLNAGGQCLRFLFIAWNILVLLIGLAAIAVGSWQIARNNDYEFVTGSEYASGGALSIVAGIIAFLVALLGAAGGFMLWRVALALYAAIVAVFVVLELAGGIAAFVLRDDLEDTVSDRALEAIQDDFTNSTDARDFVKTIQEDFECCGWDNSTDWLDSFFFAEKGKYPESCECKNSTDDDGDDDGDECITVGTGQYIYQDGCKDSVVDLLRTYQLAVGATGIVFAIAQLSAMLIALVLCCCVQKAHGEYTTV